jgi:acetyl-CoA carboxylase/biotin carboxylase 1
LKEIHYHYDEEPPYALSWDFVLRKVGHIESGLPVHSNAPSTPSTPRMETQNPFKRVASISDMALQFNKYDTEPTRKGAIIPCHYIDDVEEILNRTLEVFPLSKSRKDSTNGLIPDLNGKRSKIVINKPAEDEELTGVLLVAVSDAESTIDSEIIAKIQPIVNDYKSELVARSIRRVTFICGHSDGSYPGYFTFRGPLYQEDSTFRHIEPALAFQHELGRLSKFNIKPVFTENRNIHIYEAIGKGVEGDKRYFTRTVVRPGRLRDDIPTVEYLISEADRLMNDILDALEIVGGNHSDLNHIFINFSPVFLLNPAEVESALAGFLERFGRRAWRLRVTAAEIRIVCTDPVTNTPYPLRVFVNNTSGYVIQVDMYVERKSERGGEWVYHSVNSEKKGPMHLRPVSSPYPTKEWLQPKRYKAHIMGTQYVYDFPELFRQAIDNSWSKAVKIEPTLAKKQPAKGKCIECSELVLDDADNLAEVAREPGTNNHGMVGWLVNAKTPEYPAGRQFVIIANDITFRIGSFGPLEDRFFNKCTEFARKLGIPRIYLSANSGARIGMAEELIPHFSVAWNDPKKPQSGFKYLYLTPETYKRFEGQQKDTVITEKIAEDGEERHKITTIIGAEDGLGVECLKGSGLIAGATSKAYEDIFTITLVTCRSVGIGAYLVRLGQRAIQIEGQPIILTGAPAINKLLGREVYTSNLQLGGTQIMYKNGVSHMTANHDFEGVTKIVEWLSFVPMKKNAPLPISPFATDPWDRDVTFYPPEKAPFDVRYMIDGFEDPDGYQYGLFDRGSFVESLGGWARTVVVGRARLGGISVGVIAVETRSVENVTPADPANPESTEQITNEAGGVWYPNSAFKTAQAIKDFNYGEQLPLIILANWRGFSGGQRDMYNEVLKYGSYIVDALVKYEQPIFVYIPPFGELRGGSWVVVDPTINSEMMEMYADEEARGGVLEPEGIVNIKYRHDKQLETMSRLDPAYGELKRSLAKDDLTPDQKSEIKVKMAEREKLLLPVYNQVALQFADLHDRAGRMQAKACIRKTLVWRESRRYFYWRLRRRLDEEYILRKMKTASKDGVPRASSLEMLKAWTAIPDFATNDRAVAVWYEQNRRDIHIKVENLRKQGVAMDVASLLDTHKEAGLKGVANWISVLPTADREAVLKMLSQA